jgi:pimeloyl-ACP methyl ester carboxylesterase
MHVTVRDTKLFFDVEGPEWEVRGAELRRRRTLLLLHGGPGVDHSVFRELGAQLAHELHVVYLDHRANGRSDPAPRDSWTLQTWAEDVHAFCEAVGIQRPVVLGHSFGGYVAQAYAARFPDHPAGLILAGTAPRFVLERSLTMFSRLGGPEVADVARRFFGNPAGEFAEYLATCFPFYGRTPAPPETVARVVINVDVADHFVRGEMPSFDLRASLAAVQAPTLVLSGATDVIATPEDVSELLGCLPGSLVTHRSFGESGHEIFRDAGPAAVQAVLEFCRRSE